MAFDLFTTSGKFWSAFIAALVLLMTLPGLALFYGGMVRRKNILATMMHSMAALAVVVVFFGERLRMRQVVGIDERAVEKAGRHKPAPRPGPLPGGEGI